MFEGGVEAVDETVLKSSLAIQHILMLPNEVSTASRDELQHAKIWDREIRDRLQTQLGWQTVEHDRRDVKLDTS